ncbi:hypothetical protein HGRIS_005778 [Hohenbuehelia grisea]|uniref:DUF6532 domain-containing protein n=1 Tax=Hohenbuehelia grisea TaxID=104357 RepID=A0ABR3JYY4_9AGAR
MTLRAEHQHSLSRITAPPRPQENRKLVRRVGHVPPSTSPLRRVAHEHHQDRVTSNQQTVENEDDDNDIFDQDEYGDIDPAAENLDYNDPPREIPEPLYRNAHPDFEPFARNYRRSAGRTSTSDPSLSTIPSKRPAGSFTQPETTTRLRHAHVTVGPSGSRGRVLVRDMDTLGKTLSEDSNESFRGLISTSIPYPTRDEERDGALRVWNTAAARRGLLVELEEEIAKLIAARGPQVRGELKTKACPIVEVLYGLNSCTDVREKRDKVEALLTRASFIYKEPDARKGIYAHDAIQMVINNMWFADKGDEGIKLSCFGDGGDGIPLVTIALVLTVIENVLDEWITGKHIHIAFSSTSYKSKYEAHLNYLNEFAIHTKDAGIVPTIRKRLLKLARTHAKVDETVSQVKPGLDMSDFEAARLEWEANGVAADDL